MPAYRYITTPIGSIVSQVFFDPYEIEHMAEENVKEKLIKDLAEHNIIFHCRGVFALQIQYRGSASPLINFMIEDDGVLNLKNDMFFSAYWIDELIEELNNSKQAILSEKSKKKEKNNVNA